MLPCFNEQEHVLDELERITGALDASGLSYEVLAIDDASTDGTLEVLRAGRAADAAAAGAGVPPQRRLRNRPPDRHPAAPAARSWSGPTPT